MYNYNYWCFFAWKNKKFSATATGIEFLERLCNSVLHVSLLNNGVREYTDIQTLVIPEQISMRPVVTDYLWNAHLFASLPCDTNWGTETRRRRGNKYQPVSLLKVSFLLSYASCTLRNFCLVWLNRICLEQCSHRILLGRHYRSLLHQQSSTETTRRLHFTMFP